MLEPRDKAMMSRGVSEIIKSFGAAMTVRRNAESGPAEFSGRKLGASTLIGTYPVEIKLLSPGELTEKSADLVVWCEPIVVTKEGDQVEIDERHFIVSHVDPQNAFGEVTHIKVNLEKDVNYGS